MTIITVLKYKIRLSGSMNKTMSEQNVAAFAGHSQCDFSDSTFSQLKYLFTNHGAYHTQNYLD